MDDCTTKVCSRCKQEKPLSEFHKRKDRPLGIRSSCRSCESVKKKQRRKNDLEKARRLGKASYQRFKHRLMHGQITQTIKLSKICPRCGLDKPLIEFHKNGLRYDGHDVYCKICMSGIRKTDRALNPAKYHERSQRYLAKHSAEKYQYEKRRRLENPDRWREIRVKSYLKHLDKRKAGSRAYYEANKAALNLRSVRRRARIRGLPADFTVQDRQNAIAYFNGCCAVCGRPLWDEQAGREAAMDHWIPVTWEYPENPGTVPNNIVPLCHGNDGCNNYKAFLMPHEWLMRRFDIDIAREIAVRISEFFDWAIANRKSP